MSASLADDSVDPDLPPLHRPSPAVMTRDGERGVDCGDDLFQTTLSVQFLAVIAAHGKGERHGLFLTAEIQGNGAECTAIGSREKQTVLGLSGSLVRSFPLVFCSRSAAEAIGINAAVF